MRLKKGRHNWSCLPEYFPNQITYKIYNIRRHHIVNLLILIITSHTVIIVASLTVDIVFLVSPKKYLFKPKGFHEAGQAARIVLWLRTVNRPARKITYLILHMKKTNLSKPQLFLGSESYAVHTLTYVMCQWALFFSPLFVANIFNYLKVSFISAMVVSTHVVLLQRHPLDQLRKNNKISVSHTVKLIFLYCFKKKPFNFI